MEAGGQGGICCNPVGTRLWRSTISAVISLQWDWRSKSCIGKRHESTDASGSNSALKGWEFIRRGMWDITCETRAMTGKLP